MLKAEEKACKHPDGWADQQLREMINA